MLQLPRACKEWVAVVASNSNQRSRRAQCALFGATIVMQVGVATVRVTLVRSCKRAGHACVLVQREIWVHRQAGEGVLRRMVTGKCSENSIEFKMIQRRVSSGKVPLLCPSSWACARTCCQPWIGGA